MSSLPGYAYYNENDPKAAAWLRELIQQGHIAVGEVDERSIIEVAKEPPEFFDSFTQCHFFAGIGGWSLALRLASWPDDLECWTGSCPCQPFSCAGKQKGTDDERHLWPIFRDSIAVNRPPICFGEQVASKAGREWLAGVRTDLEGLGYVLGAADLCAASVGEEGEARLVRGGASFKERVVVSAPHIRQRLFWMAYSELNAGGQRRSAIEPGKGNGTTQARSSTELRRRSDFGGLGNNNNNGEGTTRNGTELRGDERGNHRVVGSAWSNFDIIPCRDGKAKRVESGVFPLAHGIPERVGLLRGYGNAIVPQVAAAFVEEAIAAICEMNP